MSDNSIDSKTDYKYTIGFSQSLISGIISFNGKTHFDPIDLEKGEDPYFELANMMQKVETAFRQSGYRVATDIEPKTQQVKNGQSNKEVPK